MNPVADECGFCYIFPFWFLNRRLGTVFAETKRIQLLNTIFPKLTPTSYTNTYTMPCSFLRLEQAGLIKILSIFQEIWEMTTLRMTNMMTKMSDNNITLYFFLLIAKRFTHIISCALDCTAICVCGVLFYAFPRKTRIANHLSATQW